MKRRRQDGSWCNRELNELGEGYWMLDTGCWMLDAGCWMLDARMLEINY